MHKKFCPTSFRYFGQKYMGAYGSQKAHILGHNSRTEEKILKIPKDPNSTRRVDTFWCLTWLITPSQTPAKNTWGGIGKHLWHAPTADLYMTITPIPQKAHATMNRNSIKKTALKNSFPFGLCTWQWRTDRRTDRRTENQGPGYHRAIFQNFFFRLSIGFRGRRVRIWGFYVFPMLLRVCVCGGVFSSFFLKHVSCADQQRIFQRSFLKKGMRSLMHRQVF